MIKIVLVKQKLNIWIILLFLVLMSNFMLYQTKLSNLLLTEDTKLVVAGSLLDFMVISPISFMLYKKKFSWKMAVGLFATGCIAARIIIPAHFLHPFHTVTLAGIALEAIFVMFELALIFTFFFYMPKIIRFVRHSSLPTVFSFPMAVDRHVSKNPMIYMICAETLMFYYAFCSWKQKPREGITIYKNSSLIAFQIMIIHAVIIETIGIHWLLHLLHIPPVISIILLLLNIYGVIFILGDIQALRLNPIYANEKAVYISQGVMKRVEICFNQIEEIVVDEQILQNKLPKDTLEFVAKDFEQVYPNVLIKLKSPINSTLALGIQKKYTQVAIRTDAPGEFLEMLKQGMKKSN